MKCRIDVIRLIGGSRKPRGKKKKQLGRPKCPIFSQWNKPLPGGEGGQHGSEMCQCIAGQSWMDDSCSARDDDVRAAFLLSSL
jgi:hypothetical protein